MTLLPPETSSRARSRRVPMDRRHLQLHRRAPRPRRLQRPRPAQRAARSVRARRRSNRTHTFVHFINHKLSEIQRTTHARATRPLHQETSLCSDAAHACCAWPASRVSQVAGVVVKFLIVACVCISVVPMLHASQPQRAQASPSAWIASSRLRRGRVVRCIVCSRCHRAWRAWPP